MGVRENCQTSQQCLRRGGGTASPQQATTLPAYGGAELRKEVRHRGIPCRTSGNFASVDGDGSSSLAAKTFSKGAMVFVIDALV